MRLNLSAGIAAGLALAGCAGIGEPTHYGPEAFGGGYKDREAEPGVWRVVGTSNALSPPGFGAEMAAYRAAELLSQQGFSHVQILDQQGSVFQFGQGGRRIGDRLILFVRGANDAAEPENCRSDLEAACYTFNAREVMERLAPVINASRDENDR